MTGDSTYKTLKRFDEPGHARLINFACFHNQPLLSSDRTCHLLVEAIERARAKHGFHLWAWVNMPDHVHMLMLPRADTQMASILLSIKQSVANKALALIRGNAPELIPRLTDGSGTLRFWQRGGGYDRNLWTPKHIWEAIDYIHMNPVKKGLCEKPWDWEWSSALAFREPEEMNVLRLDVGKLPVDPR